jgi:hypothetical protein
LVELDLLRTLPDEPYFEGHRPGCHALRNVLSAFVKYDPLMGYVQGMNFITASLLWHSSEEDAFWLFVMLMEDYSLRENFLPNLPGLSTHCQVIELLTYRHLTPLYMVLEDCHVPFELFASEWCYSLFANIVPPQEMAVLLDKFFAHGWPFFYRLVLVILFRLSPKLSVCRDFIEAVSILKPPHSSHWRMFLPPVDNERMIWKSLVEEAENTEIVEYLQLNFKETAKFCSVNYAN